MKKLSPKACGKHAKPVTEVLKSQGYSINYLLVQCSAVASKQQCFNSTRSE